MFDMVWAVLRYGGQKQPVLIDVYSTYNFYYALLVAMLCRIRGIRYHCVLRGGNLPDRLIKHPRQCQTLFGRAKMLIAPSGYLQHAFELAGYDNVRIIPNFIPLSNYPFRQRGPLRPRILWVRAFDAIYNPKMAVEMFQRIHEEYPDAELCMVGPDKDGSRLDCEVLASKLGLSKQVSFTGRLSKAEWISLSEHYDIFINTTNFDNSPVSVIEAMALGLPVVSTNVGGLPYLIDSGKDGILVSKGDIEAMSDAVHRLITDETLARRIVLGAREKAETFDWMVVKRQWLDVLKNSQ